MIKFVVDLRQVGGFLLVLQSPPTNKIDSHDIREILLKVALNIIVLANLCSLCKGTKTSLAILSHNMHNLGLD